MVVRQVLAREFEIGVGKQGRNERLPQIEEKAPSCVYQVSLRNRGSQARAFNSGTALPSNFNLLINTRCGCCRVVLKLRIRSQGRCDLAGAIRCDTLSLCLQSRIGTEELVSNLLPCEVLLLSVSRPTRASSRRSCQQKDCSESCDRRPPHTSIASLVTSPKLAITGITNKMASDVVIIPPTTTRANGCWA